jgi:hypothetical protein
MKRHIFQKITQINKFGFPVLVAAAYLSLLVDSYKYIGFLSKHTLVDPRYLLVLSLVSAIFLVTKRANALGLLVFKINAFLILPIATVGYLTMRLLEAFHFNNYVFSTYHVQPVGFFYIVVFSFALAATYKLIGSPNLNKTMLLLLIPVFFIDNLTKVLDSAISSNLYVMAHINYSYADKMSASWGIYYDYTQFIKANTPEGSSILVPPQGYPWFLTGNIGVDRYFLYPRKLVNGDERQPGTNLNNVDYILIDYGETNISQHGFTNIWPKFDVDGEYLIYWNPLDGSTERVDNGKYIYKAENKEQWGIIRVKHDI